MVQDNPRRQAEIVETLKAAGMRCTSTRALLINLLSSARRPLSRAEILRRIRDVKVDPVTVHRCLQRFVESGLVHAAYFDDGALRFETADRCRPDRCHPHFTCRICGETTCMEEAEAPLARNLRRGFIAERQRVYIRGVCSTCAGA